MEDSTKKKREQDKLQEPVLEPDLNTGTEPALPITDQAAPDNRGAGSGYPPY